MAKVGQERAARIGGRVVEVDFYLRQITCLEISFDLLAEGQRMDAWQAIAVCRRGGHGILEIGDTTMSRVLDDARREQWEKMGEPARPEHPPARFLVDHGTHRTEGAQCLGKASPPLPGYAADEWAAMSIDGIDSAVSSCHLSPCPEQLQSYGTTYRLQDTNAEIGFVVPLATNDQPSCPILNAAINAS